MDINSSSFKTRSCSFSLRAPFHIRCGSSKGGCFTVHLGFHWSRWGWWSMFQKCPSFLSNGFPKKKTEPKQQPKHPWQSIFILDTVICRELFRYTSSDLHGWNLQNHPKPKAKSNSIWSSIGAMVKKKRLAAESATAGLEDLLGDGPEEQEISVSQRLGWTMHVLNQLSPVSLWRPCWNTEKERIFCPILVWNDNTIRKYAKKFNEKMDKIEAARAAKILSCTQRCYCSIYCIYIYIFVFFAILAGWLLPGFQRFWKFMDPLSWFRLRILEDEDLASNSSDETTEDENAELLTGRVESKIFETLSKIKAKDPSIYDT